MTPEYEVSIASTGKVILTTPHKNRALAHAKHRTKELGALRVEEVERITVRKHVYTTPKVKAEQVAA